MVQYVSHKLPHVWKLFYFSDGCAGQYKHNKNVTNLLHHKEDFGLDAEWHIFAASHRKNACDGVGGTIKRLATYASLQHPLADQTVTPIQLFEFCDNESTNITSFYISRIDSKNICPFSSKDIMWLKLYQVHGPIILLYQ